MRQKRKNSKRANKTKTKSMQQSVLPRLDTQAESSADNKVKTKKKNESFLPNLKPSVITRKGNGFENHGKLSSTDLVGLLPSLDQQRKNSKKLVPPRKDILHERVCNRELKKNFSSSTFEISRKEAVNENQSNKNSNDVYRTQKQMKKSRNPHSKDLEKEGTTSNAFKDKRPECKRRARQLNQLNVKQSLTNDWDHTQHKSTSINDIKEHKNNLVCGNKTTKQPKQVNLHFTPIITKDSLKENLVSTICDQRAKSIHVNKNTKSKRKFQTSFNENPSNEVNNQELEFKKELGFQVGTELYEASLDFCSALANQHLLKREQKYCNFNNSNVANSKEVTKSGPMNSPESGLSEWAMNPDEGFCEQDVIFEEIIRDGNHENAQRTHKGKPKTMAQNKAFIRNFSKKAEKLKSGLDWRKDTGSALLTKEFQVEGLEVALKDIPPKRKPKAISVSSQKPRIPRHKEQIKNDCSIQGYKVKGCSVDIDEYVISMVRFVNCNDKSTEEDLRDFPGRRFLWSP